MANEHTVRRGFEKILSGDFTLEYQSRRIHETKLGNDALETVVEANTSQTTRELAASFRFQQNLWYARRSAQSLTSIILIVKSNPTHEDEKRLKDNLLLNYRKDIRPVIDLFTSVDIYTDLDLHTLYDLDFVNNILKARYMIGSYWTDAYLIWKPSEYNNITEINLPRQEIWTPSLIMCNSVNEPDDTNINQETKIYYDGTVEMWSLKYIETYCQVNAYTYPFDEHKCEIHICVAVQSIRQTRIQKMYYKNLNVTENYKWDINMFGVVFQENDAGSQASAVMYLRRKPTVGIIAMLIPTVMMTVLTIFVFVLPPESGEKVSLATTIFLSNVLYLVEIDKNTPKNSKYPSLLMLYLMLLSMLSGMVTLGSVVISKLYVNRSSREKKSTDRKKNKSQSNNIADISIISMVKSESLEGELQSKKKRNCISDYIRLDAIFLKIGIVISIIISILFTTLLFTPME
ncbi:acetylcholine receptor subunit alpha-like 2 [Octopus bimaculoides]|uniref:acetylcholine receptor subunit alpha-like 2 n=1 Tax=Octopus bimaculoides TaxID=37653 RepID=UPI0022E75FCE|nr:acetylcholine receptor subunit alpha-like 2 [Octopus bimaculoides]